MAITGTERDQLVKLIVGMFNAAPGSTYLAAASSLYEGTGCDFSATAKTLAATPLFRQVHHETTNQQFAAAFLAQFGLQDNATAMQFVNDRLSAGLDKGTVIAQALPSPDALDPADGG